MSVHLCVHASVCLPVCLSICLLVFVGQFCIFLRNGLLVFSDFWHGGRWLEYIKTHRAFCCRKIQFYANLGKKGSKWPQIAFLDFLKNFVIIFLGNNLKWKLLLLLIWQNSVSQVMAKNAVSQSKLQDSLKCNISRKKWMTKSICGMQINTKVFDKLILSFWMYLSIHAQSTQNKKFACLYKISRKAWGI